MPGHTAKAKGCVSVFNQEPEHDIAVKVLKELQSLETALPLEFANMDGSMTITQKIEYERAGRYEGFVELHFNSTANPEAEGSEALCWQGSQRGTLLGTLILLEIQNIQGGSLKQRGLKLRKKGDRGWRQLGLTRSPATILEPLFLSNITEATIASLPGYQGGLARAILKGLEEYAKAIR